jgi:hypothetical protein
MSGWFAVLVWIQGADRDAEPGSGQGAGASGNMQDDNPEVAIMTV